MKEGDTWETAGGRTDGVLARYGREEVGVEVNAQVSGWDSFMDTNDIH